MTSPRRLNLVSVQGHTLRVSAQFPVRSRRNGPAAMTLSAALLECEQLLSTEGLVVNLRSRLNKILQVSSQEEISQVDKFAVILVFYVDHAPTVLSAAYLLAVHNDGLLGAYNSEWNEVLQLRVSDKHAATWVYKHKP